MQHIVVFYVAQLFASGYAFRRGGGPERVVATLMILAAVGTSVASMGPGLYRDVNDVHLFIDVVFMAALVAVALRADRYWPMYIAALHLLGVGVHGVRAYDPQILPIVYSRAPAALAYPMLLILVIGTARHAGRIRQGAPVRSWSLFRW